MWIESGAWPIVCVSMPASISDEVVEQFCEELLGVLRVAQERRQRVVLCFDPSGCAGVRPAHVMRLGRVLSENRPLLSSTVRRSFLVVRTSVWRGVFKTLFMVAPPTRPVAIVSHPSRLTLGVLGCFVHLTKRWQR
jgi:hypothetical protein